MPLAYEPLWDGLAIFGVATTVVRASERPRAQRSTYPGLRGVQVTRLGSSGQRLKVSGTLAAWDVDGLAALENALYDLEQSQTSGEFRDSIGNVYQDSLIENLQHASEIMPYSDEEILDGVSRDFSLEVACPYSS